MLALRRTARFKTFFLFLGAPFILLGGFGFVFMAVSLGWDFPGAYMALIFPLVGFVLIGIDLHAWRRYFFGKRILDEGCDGVATFVSYEKTNMYVKRSKHGIPHNMNFYLVVYSFADENGKTVTQRTPPFWTPKETEAMRRLKEIRIKHLRGRAVITQDLQQAIVDLGISENPDL